MANYEIIEGCRKDSFIYVNEGYTYRKDKDVKGSTPSVIHQHGGFDNYLMVLSRTGDSNRMKDA